MSTVQVRLLGAWGSLLKCGVVADLLDFKRLGSQSLLSSQPIALVIKDQSFDSCIMKMATLNAKPDSYGADY
jgi:hypothetical protein